MFFCGAAAEDVAVLDVAVLDVAVLDVAVLDVAALDEGAADEEEGAAFGVTGAVVAAGEALVRSDC
ncbi:hypothetical protein HMPREF3149_02450 [Corynebacterium sp. HMSC05E07]|nr:hypothetical protein HMPREF3149_02450 [Corynebacterium sp. HMSC05E07]